MAETPRSDFWTPKLALGAFWIVAVPLLIAFGTAIAFQQWLLSVWFLVSVFFVRMWVELALVLFKIYDVLVDIRDKDKPDPEREEKIARARAIAQKVQRRNEPGEMRLG